MRTREQIQSSSSAAWHWILLVCVALLGSPVAAVDGKVAFRHVGYNEKAIPTIVGEINSLLVKNNLVGETT